MGGINTTRLLVGGLAAGLVINIGEVLLNVVVLGGQMESVMAARNLPPPQGAAIAVFLLLGFALGIGIVWVYAAVRPRFGAGPKTALIAGTMVWLLAYLYSGIGMTVMGMFPAGLMTLGLAWGLVELLAAAYVGAGLYREEEVMRGVGA